MTDHNYDREDIVRRESLMLAGGLKFAAYRVRNPAFIRDATNPWSDLQFHLTYMPQEEINGRTVVTDGAVAICAMISEKIASDFSDFLKECVGWEESLLPGDSRWSKVREATFICYRRSDNNIEFQIRRDDMVLAVMLKGMAKMFCKLTQRAINPEPPMTVLEVDVEHRRVDATEPTKKARKPAKASKKKATKKKRAKK